MSSSTIFTLTNELTVLAAGRRPQWVLQGGGPLVVDSGGGTGAPPPSQAGTTLSDALVTLLAFTMRPDPSKRTATIEVNTLDVAGTYRLTINAANSDFDASAVLPSPPTTLAEFVEAWATYINGDATVNGVVTAEAVDLDGDLVNDHVIIRGISEADYSYAAGPIVGTGVITSRIDPVTAIARVYVRGQTPNAPPGPLSAPPESGNGTNGWHNTNGGNYSLNTRNLVVRASTGGLSALYVAVEAVEGNASDASLANGALKYTVWLSIGPCVNELGVSL